MHGAQKYSGRGPLKRKGALHLLSCQIWQRLADYQGNLPTHSRQSWSWFQRVLTYRVLGSPVKKQFPPQPHLFRGRPKPWLSRPTCTRLTAGTDTTKMLLPKSFKELSELDMCLFQKTHYGVPLEGSTLKKSHTQAQTASCATSDTLE